MEASPGRYYVDEDAAARGGRVRRPVLARVLVGLGGAALLALPLGMLLD